MLHERMRMLTNGAWYCQQIFVKILNDIQSSNIGICLILCDLKMGFLIDMQSLLPNRMIPVMPIITKTDLFELFWNSSIQHTLHKCIPCNVILLLVFYVISIPISRHMLHKCIPCYTILWPVLYVISIPRSRHMLHKCIPCNAIVLPVFYVISIPISLHMLHKCIPCNTILLLVFYVISIPKSRHMLHKCIPCNARSIACFLCDLHTHISAYVT